MYLNLLSYVESRSIRVEYTYLPTHNGAAAQHTTIIYYIIRTDRDDDCDTRHLKWGPC